MAIDTPKKMRSIVGLGNPMFPTTVDVNASLDGADRASIGWTYSGFTFAVGIVWTAIGSAFKSDQTERASGRYRELFAADDLTI